MAGAALWQPKVQISWQAQHFVPVQGRVQISWQAQHVRKVKYMAGAALSQGQVIDG